MKTAIYPGSFDPITSGHLNIIERAANIFDKLIVCVMVNAGKNPMFSLEERVALIKKATKNLSNVEVDCSNELLADYARRRGSCVIVKGLRAGSDFENEQPVNNKVNGNKLINIFFISRILIKFVYLYIIIVLFSPDSEPSTASRLLK